MKTFENVLIHGFVALLLATSIFPIAWLFMVSTKSPLEVFARPPVWIYKPILDNYYEIFVAQRFDAYILNSIVISSCSTALSVAIGSLGAYSFARFKFRGSRNIAAWILSTRMFPPIAAAVPIFILWKQVGLFDTQLGLTIVYAASNLPYVVWMMRAFLLEIPRELEEAAMVDGCTRLGALTRIVLPLARPGLTATSILCIILSWNEFLFALVLTSMSAKTASVAITGYITAYGVKWGEVGAAAIAVTIPVIIFGLLAQRHLVRGLTFGAVKG